MYKVASIQHVMCREIFPNIRIHIMCVKERDNGSNTIIIQKSDSYCGEITDPITW